MRASTVWGWTGCTRETGILGSEGTSQLAPGDDQLHDLGGSVADLEGKHVPQPLLEFPDQLKLKIACFGRGLDPRGPYAQPPQAPYLIPGNVAVMTFGTPVLKGGGLSDGEPRSMYAALRPCECEDDALARVA